MSQTTYYEFNKPEGTDLVNPLVDTNPNWDKLDNDLHEFNERSIANCTEVVSLGVHTISRLDTTSKFLKWIATANFTAGETFTVDGVVVAASTPAGAALATGAYVTGSVVLACLNADNSAMTIFVSGTTVATDSERLGGELPAYYAKQIDMSGAQTDITNLKNQVGNTSLVGIGDGTATGAISFLKDEIDDIDVGLITLTATSQSTTGDAAIASLPNGLTAENYSIIGFSIIASNNIWYGSPQDVHLYISDTLIRLNTTNSAYLNKQVKVVLFKYN
ncbi:MAG: hypothetical protein U0L26_09920 [Cellulosilyticum sp.]|nr:hypothetical protein [Cellulosilyticum sp.]